MKSAHKGLTHIYSSALCLTSQKDTDEHGKTVVVRAFQP